MRPYSWLLFSLVLIEAHVQSGFSAEVRFKTRAIWVDPPSFSSEKAADEMVRRCQQAGFNLILPNVMSHQSIAFSSSHFAGRARTRDFDPLAYTAKKAHAAGMKVQAWCCVYYEGSGSRSNSALHPDWLCRSMDGRPFEQNFLSPANPEVNPYLLSVISDLIPYEIDGIHLDYIRYPGTPYDFSPAGRAACQKALGFDPQDFLDNADRIVPPSEDPFPVRVLHPKIHAEKVWETTALERTLDQAAIGFGFVSESPENIAKLRTPGLLIVSSYYNAPPEMIGAFRDYTARGGNLLWSDLSSKLLEGSEELRKLTGLKSIRWTGEKRIAVRNADEHPLGKSLPKEAFRVNSMSIPTADDAKVVARLDSGDPALTIHQIGNARILVTGFPLIKSTSPAVASFSKAVVDWLRIEAGVTTPDRLGAKRAEWINWRAAGIAELVRGISQRAKARNLAVSSSAGPSPFEFYSCYRDARGWLGEGINDHVFPMNYTPDPAVLAEVLELQEASAPPGTKDRIFPGLQIYKRITIGGTSQTIPMDPATVEKQLTIVRDQGWSGFCLFAYNTLTDDTIAVVRKFSE